jgi:hypothetical protein
MWTCLNCDGEHSEDVLFRCELCGETICPDCFQAHDDTCNDPGPYREDEHVGQLGWGQE